MSSSPISIQPLSPEDFHSIAALEVHSFSTDPISVHAWGPQQDSLSALQKRAQSLAEPSCAYPPSRMRKAVTTKGQVVGFALWKFFTDLERNPRSAIEKEKDSEASVEEQSKWPEGANVQLCEAVFSVSDECCRLVMRGRKYAVLNILVVSPEYRGRGIGSMLIREGLEVVDSMGLSVWLGATEVAIPLYKRVGFQVESVMEFDMALYGGHGLTKHILMIRPARKEKANSEA